MWMRSARLFPLIYWGMKRRMGHVGFHFVPWKGRGARGDSYCLNEGSADSYAMCMGSFRVTKAILMCYWLIVMQNYSMHKSGVFIMNANHVQISALLSRMYCLLHNEWLLGNHRQSCNILLIEDHIVMIRILFPGSSETTSTQTPGETMLLEPVFTDFILFFLFQEQFEFALTAVAEEVNAILKALPQ